jgi:hypothetical protein
LRKVIKKQEEETKEIDRGKHRNWIDKMSAEVSF